MAQEKTQKHSVKLARDLAQLSVKRKLQSKFHTELNMALKCVLQTKEIAEETAEENE